jgi:hypothetical protein
MKQHSLPSHPIQMRRLGNLVPVTPKVIPRDVIGDEEYEVGLLGVGEGNQPNCREENNKAFHVD